MSAAWDNAAIRTADGNSDAKALLIGDDNTASAVEDVSARCLPAQLTVERR